MTRKNNVRLDDYLALNTYMIKLFGMDNFDDFRKLLKDVETGFDEEGRSGFFKVLSSQSSIKSKIREKLEDYDHNIKYYLDYINTKRDTNIELTYFQYLAVLYTEIFFDYYFYDPVELANDINDELSDFFERIDDYDFLFAPEDLDKIAFWMATGSGKTLLFHINYLQFLNYNKGPNAFNFNNLLLITPNESLSKQHFDEMKISNIPCEILQSQDLGFFSQYTDSKNVIKIIDIYKFIEEKKKQGKSVDVESFENNNIVFVDEGHKGSGGDKWLKYRDYLTEYGFTIEYSATFGQAVAMTGKKKEKNGLIHKYGKSILFDYSYRYFYKDGYGKDYSILNLKEFNNNDEFTEQSKRMLLLANLLTFYEQKLIFKNQSDDIIETYNLENPLWVFVGSKVKASNKNNKSDIYEVILFLNQVLKNENNWVIKSINNIFNGNSGLKDNNEQDIFSPEYPGNKLSYLRDNGFKPEEIYRDILVKIFHNNQSSPLHILNISNASGEIALRCGDGDYFGLINIGDENELIKLIDNSNTDIRTDKDEISSSLFYNIKQKNSNINILIGAKKFIEGWNSWRVSNMGLINFGKNEGTQIIQLFGRGVRLKGKYNSLKRSKEIEDNPPEYISLLETLNIFGIRANYMQQFKEYLENEGMPTTKYFETTIPIKVNNEFLKNNLFVPKINTKQFKKQMFLELDYNEDIDPVDIDLTSKIEKIESQEKGITTQTAVPNKIIEHKYLDLLDWNRIYHSLLNFKVQNGWNNLIFTKENLKDIIKKDYDTYNLKCDNNEYIYPNRFEQLWYLEDMVISILKKYIRKFYNSKKHVWSKNNFKIKELDKNDGNFTFKKYKITVDGNYKYIINEIDSLKNDKNLKQIYDGKIKDINNVYFDEHLYQPLIANDGSNDKIYKTSPPSLNDGESQFVKDLKNYVLNHPDKFKDKKLFLLRNQPKKGIGLPVGYINYYPDFVIWVISDDKQNLIFADPKGLAHTLNGFDDEKIQAHKSVKNIEKDLNKYLSVNGYDQKINLDSYIISLTDRNDLKYVFGTPIKSAYNDKNILFQNEDNYIHEILTQIT